jgi:hypothetical protein
MIPYEIDPSLHTAQPAPEQLDDGFSPPVAEAPVRPDAAPPEIEPALWDKSEF